MQTSASNINRIYQNQMKPNGKFYAMPIRWTVDCGLWTVWTSISRQYLLFAFAELKQIFNFAPKITRQTEYNIHTDRLLSFDIQN